MSWLQSRCHSDNSKGEEIKEGEVIMQTGPAEMNRVDLCDPFQIYSASPMTRGDILIVSFLLIYCRLFFFSWILRMATHTERKQGGPRLTLGQALS